MARTHKHEKEIDRCVRIRGTVTHLAGGCRDGCPRHGRRSALLVHDTSVFEDVLEGYDVTVRARGVRDGAGRRPRYIHGVVRREDGDAQVMHRLGHVVAQLHSRHPPADDDDLLLSSTVRG